MQYIALKQCTFEHWWAYFDCNRVQEKFADTKGLIRARECNCEQKINKPRLSNTNLTHRNTGKLVCSERVNSLYHTTGNHPVTVKWHEHHQTYIYPSWYKTLHRKIKIGIISLQHKLTSYTSLYFIGWKHIY
jgi:hypothetical protein